MEFKLWTGYNYQYHGVKSDPQYVLKTYAKKIHVSH